MFYVQSLSNKSCVTNNLILDYKINRLFLTEIWLGSDVRAVLSEASPPIYNFVFSTRRGLKGGGTTTLMKSFYLYGNHI